MSFGNKFGNKRSSFGRNKKSGIEGKKPQKFIGGGKISAVEFQQSNPDRVNIFVEDEYAFSLAAVLVAERHLRAGVVLSEEDSAELQSADLYNKGLAMALQLLAMRPRSQAEIQTHFRKRYPDADTDTVKAVIERLQDLNYLNDASFAAFWVENRSAFAPRGRNLLRQELMKKGVPRDIIDAAITTTLDAEAEEGDDEAEGGLKLEESQALDLARKQGRRYAAENWQGFYRKLGGFLLRRGYAHDITSRVSKQVWQELKNEATPDDDYLEEEGD